MRGGAPVVHGSLVAKSNFRPQFGECKLRMSIIFDFATSILKDGEPSQEDKGNTCMVRDTPNPVERDEFLGDFAGVACPHWRPL